MRYAPFSGSDLEFGEFSPSAIRLLIVPKLTIRGLSSELHRRLKRQAEANHRSLSEEVIVCLERALASGPVDPKRWLVEAAALRQRLALRPLSRARLRSARARGRAQSTRSHSAFR